MSLLETADVKAGNNQLLEQQLGWLGPLVVCALPALATSWCLSILLFPWIVHQGWVWTSTGIMLFFSHVCHQDSARSLGWLGVAFPVCARCLGLYVGGWLGMGCSIALGKARIWEQTLVKLILLSSCLLLLDVVLDGFNFRSNTIHSRALTGGMLGASGAFYAMRAALRLAGRAEIRST
ncbi:MAG: DUF2085 domain-containing protein [Acidobacteriota bacterium]